MTKDTRKPGLPSHQARENSANSPWRKQAHCQTKKAHAMREKLNEGDNAVEIPPIDTSKVPF